MRRLFKSLFLNRKRTTVVLLSFTAALMLCGCRTVSFYGQAIRGQYQMVTDRQPIQELIEAEGTDRKLRDKFQLVMEIREFAKKELALPIDGHYENYVDLHRSNVVWNVYAAEELSLKPKTWWYPIVGKLTYRGYFNEAAAEKTATSLRKEYDVYVGGVDAYSTLGWFKDPVLNTFIDSSERRLASLLFHELAHQRLFIAGDTEFNEAFATALAEEGLHRWLLAKNDPAQAERAERDRNRRTQFVGLVLETREQLRSIYESAQPEAVKRREKNRVIAGLRSSYEQLKKNDWNGFSGYDDWFAGPLNNAQLNTISTYYTLVPAFHQLIQESNGDLEKFYVTAQKLMKLNKNERHQVLANILKRPAPAQAVVRNERPSGM